MCDKIILIFEQECNKTKDGDSLFVTGEIQELGNWDLNKSQELFTGKENFPKFPNWKSNPICVPYKDKLSLEYKYFIKKKNGEEKWENFDGNRKIEISDLKCCTYIIKDNKFGDKSNYEIIGQSNDLEKEIHNSNKEENKNNENDIKNEINNSNKEEFKNNENDIKNEINNSNKEENKNNENDIKNKINKSNKEKNKKNKYNKIDKKDINKSNKKENKNNENDIKNEINNSNEEENQNDDKKVYETKDKEPTFENTNDIKEKNNEHKKEMDLLECKIGLENIGATCYMNSTLQCFCHIKEFINYFKGNSQELNKETLAYSFKLLIDELWPDDPNNVKKFYSPYNMKEKIAKMNPLFEGIAACDAKDLVNFIIMKLHTELNKVKNPPKNNNNIFLDQTKQSLVFDCFIQDFKNNNQSIISDLFYGTNKNITQCSFCNYTVYNYQIFFFLNFPLEEVRKFKNPPNNNFNNNNMYNNYNNNFSYINYNMCFNNNCMNNNVMFNNFTNNIFMNNNSMNNNFMNNNVMNNNFINNNNNFINNNCINNSSNEVNIYDCFEYDRKVNFMTGENRMFCNSCKTNQDCLMKTDLVLGPEVLIILLNRGKGLEFDVKIKFTKTLDLSNYFDIKDPGCKYELIGVITHIGENNMGGHFIAYCKDHISNKWLLFNDAIVDYVKDFEKEVINFSTPYLLFYRRIKGI